MVALTDRYEVESIDPLCDGWQFGLGYDTRLQRQVLIAIVSNQVARQQWFKEWLQRRSAVSHTYVAELLDGEQLQASFLCIFSRPEHVHIGLPSLSDQQICEAAEKITIGAKMLYAENISFHFSAGQVLWDGQNPKLLGLPMGITDQGFSSGEENPMAISHYTASLLVWHASVQSEKKHSSSLHFQVAADQLKQFSQTGEAGFVELSDMLIAIKNQQPIDASTIESDVEEAITEDDESVSGEDSSFDERTVTAFPLRGWLTFAIVIIVIIAGLVWWFGRPGTSGTAQPSGGNSTVPTPLPSNTKKSNIKVMPNLVGESIISAINKLEHVGVNRGNISLITKTVSSGTGQIISTFPRTHQRIDQGQKIALTVGVTSGSVLVPDLSGLSIHSAAQQLLALQLHYSYVYQNSSLANKGQVIAQEPKPYAMVSRNSLVKFVVAAHY